MPHTGQIPPSSCATKQFMIPLSSRLLIIKWKLKVLSICTNIIDNRVFVAIYIEKLEDKRMFYLLWKIKKFKIKVTKSNFNDWNMNLIQFIFSLFSIQSILFIWGFCVCEFIYSLKYRDGSWCFYLMFFRCYDGFIGV